MNITKKRLLKIKNTKNQSRKKVYPKYKKKYKKNKSFRRRRKHNLQNKSLKKYKKLIKRKRKKANKKGGNKIVIGKEIILNQLVPKSADANNDEFILMPGRYSPITKTILLGNENIVISNFIKTLEELIKNYNEEKKKQNKKITNKVRTFFGFFPSEKSKKEIDNFIKSLIDFYSNKEKQQQVKPKKEDKEKNDDATKVSQLDQNLKKEFKDKLKNELKALNKPFDPEEKKEWKGEEVQKEGKENRKKFDDEFKKLAKEKIYLKKTEKEKEELEKKLKKIKKDILRDNMMSVMGKDQENDRFQEEKDADLFNKNPGKWLKKKIDDLKTEEGKYNVHELTPIAFESKEEREKKRKKFIKKYGNFDKDASKIVKGEKDPAEQEFDEMSEDIDRESQKKDIIMAEIEKRLRLIVKDLKEKPENDIQGANWLKTPVTIQYQENKPENMLPLWKYINSIALLTQSDIVSNDSDNKDSINVNNFKRFKISIDEIIKNDKTGDFNKQIVFYHYPTVGVNKRNCLPLFNWRDDNNIFKSHHKKELTNIKSILKELNTPSSSGGGQSGGNIPSDSVINLNNFIKKVMEAKDKEKYTKVGENLYANFLNTAGKMKNQLEFIEYNKRLFEKEKDEIIGKLHNLDAEKKKLENFDSQQEKNNLVKLFVNIREKLMNNLLEGASPEKRAEIQMKFQKFKKDKQKETDAIDAQLKISQGKEAATSVPKTPGSFSMGNHFNAIANDKYPNDQYIVPESLDPWGITIDPEKNGLFARFNIRQHPYQFDKDNEVINEFNLVDTPEWLQFVGDSLEDRRGITPAYKPPEGTVSGATTDEAIEEQKDEVKALERKSKKLKEGKISRLDRGKQMLKGNFRKKSALKGQQEEVEKQKGQAETLLKVKQDTRKADDKKEADEAAKKKEEDIKEKAKDEIKEEEKEEKKEGKKKEKKEETKKK